METETQTLKLIQKVLALEKAPHLDAHFFDDLNAHHEDLEKIKDLINQTYDLELGDGILDTVETVRQIVQIVKDKTNDIS
jgi:acyl carrier protein